MKFLFAFVLIFVLFSCEKDQSIQSTLEELKTSKEVVHLDTLDLFAQISVDGDVRLWFRNYWLEGESFIYTRPVVTDEEILIDFQKRPWTNLDEGDERFDRFVGGMDSQDFFAQAIVVLKDTLFISQEILIPRVETKDLDLLDIDLRNPVKPEFSWSGNKRPPGGYLHQLFDREGKLLTSMTWPSEEFDFYTIFDATNIYIDDYAQPELVAGQRYRFEVFGLDTNRFALWHDSREFFAVENGLIDE